MIDARRGDFSTDVFFLPETLITILCLFDGGISITTFSNMIDKQKGEILSIIFLGVASTSKVCSQ